MSAKEIRDRVVSFLAGEQSLDDFEDWFVQQTWNVHLHAAKDVQELVHVIEEDAR